MEERAAAALPNEANDAEQTVCGGATFQDVRSLPSCSQSLSALNGSPAPLYSDARQYATAWRRSV